MGLTCGNCIGERQIFCEGAFRRCAVDLSNLTAIELPNENEDLTALLEFGASTKKDISEDLLYLLRGVDCTLSDSNIEYRLQEETHNLQIG